MPLPRAFRSGTRAASIGLEIAIAITIGALGGHWLDQKFATRPWLLIVGLLLGAAAGARLLFTFYRHAIREHENDPVHEAHLVEESLEIDLRADSNRNLEDDEYLGGNPHDQG